MYGEDVLESFSGAGAPAMDTSDWASQFNPGNFDAATSMPPSWMTATPGQEGSGSPVGDWASKLFGNVGQSFADKPLQSLTSALGLGTSALGIGNAIGAMTQGRQQQQLQRRAQDMAFSAAQPAIDYGKTQLNQAQAGQLLPAMEAAIAQKVEQAKADARAKFARLGISDSTMIEAEMRRIDNEALAMKAQLLQGEGAQGLQALNVGAGTGLQAGGQGGQQEALIAQILQAANQQMALMGSRG